MKYNLKNRPAFTRRRYPKGTCAPDIEEMLDWFEGFEKELKDVLKQEVYGDQVYYRICDSCVMRNTCMEYGLECEALQKLKEILNGNELC